MSYGIVNAWSGGGETPVGGGGLLPRIDVYVPNGTTVTVAKGSTQLEMVGNNTICFDIPEYGDWTVSATGSDKTYTISVDAVKVYTVAFTTLSATPWSTIAAVSESGMADLCWKVGDEKVLMLSSSPGPDSSVDVVIMGFYCDELANGRKAGITFGMKNLLNRTTTMNSAPVETNTAIDFALNADYYTNFSVELQRLIKEVVKRTGRGGMSNWVDVTRPSAGQNIYNRAPLFLFSYGEIFGANTALTGSEGEQYPYFRSLDHRKKYFDNGTGQLGRWWTRSPYEGDDQSFYYVTTDGTAATEGAKSGEFGICFGFCI